MDFRSLCMRSWQLSRVLLPILAGALSEQDGAGDDMAGILDMYFHGENPERILFAGPGYYHWVTSDFGRTFSKVRTLLHVPVKGLQNHPL